IATVRFDARYSPRGGFSRPVSRNGAAQKATAGFALGFLGMLGGVVIGSRLGRDCACDDPGLKGAIIGAPIGAIAGAIAGVRLASCRREGTTFQAPGAARRKPAGSATTTRISSSSTPKSSA